MGEGEDQVRPGEEAKTSDEIREDIERTRMELEETVDALGAKLKPRRIAKEGWQAVKTSSEQGANRLVRIARDYPIPMGLIGVGVTWLVIESRRRAAGESWTERGEGDYSEFASPGEYEGSAAYGSEGRNLADRAREKMAGAKDAIGDAAGRVSDTASSAAQRVRDAASQAGSKVGQVAGSVRDRAVDLGQRTGYQVRRARDSYWDLVERRPIAAGMATLAVGLLIGLLIPTTQRERELMGETRDDLLRGVKETGRETFEKTKEVARSAVDAASEAAQTEAERQNLKL
jgi:ElaB/YqjD/DUF883 family membrane-anchored ribosome-binding protein